MGTGELTFWNSGVWLIPLFLLATLVGLFLLIRYWQQKTETDQKELRRELRRLQEQRQALFYFTQRYTPMDPEPYGSRAAALLSRLEAIDVQFQRVQTGRVEVQEGSRQLAATRWQSTLGAPYFWYTLRRAVASLYRQLASLENSLDEASALIQEVEGLPWQIAQGARQIEERRKLAARQIDEMLARHMQGAALQAAIQEEQEVRTALGKIPHYFLEADDASVREQAETEAVAQTHRIVEQVRPTLDELQSKLKTWQKQYESSVEKVNAMRQTVDRAESALQAPPPGLDLRAEEARLNQLKVIADTLQATLTRLEVESAESVISEAERVAVAAAEMRAEVQKGRHAARELEELLPALSTNLKELSNQFAALATSAIHPVRWEDSRKTLTELSREAGLIGPSNRARTPQQAIQDLADAKSLEEQRKKLADRCAEVARQHDALLKLLETPELQEGMERYDRAQRLLERVDLFSPENFPTAGSFQELRENLETFRQGLQELVLEESSKAIPESEIPGRLDKTQALVALYEKLREQLEALRLRLSELQDQEKQAGEELESARALLNQSALLARSNTFLESIAAAEINRLQQTQEQLLLDLKNRQRGSVEKKAKAASGLLERIGATASGWMEKMDKELGTLKGELGGKLAELENIAPLEESAIVEARRLMAEGQAFGPEGRKRSVDREEQVLAIKRRSEYWQNLQAALNAVDDMAAPVLESYEAMQHNRQYAIDRIADITAWMRSSQHWPPTSVTIDAERHDLEETDRKWEALKARPAKAINLVQTIGNLAARYATIGDRVQSSAEHVAQEKGQVESLEDEIDELAAQWQQQIQSYGQSPEAGEEIRRLLGDLQGQREALKRQYRQGTRSYEEIMQTLKELQRQLRNAQVTVDDNHVIDVNGRLIAYR